MQLPEQSPVLELKGSSGHHLPEEVSLRMTSSHPVEQKTDRHQPFQNLFWLIFNESKNSLRSRHPGGTGRGCSFDLPFPLKNRLREISIRFR